MTSNLFKVIFKPNALLIITLNRLEFITGYLTNDVDINLGTLINMILCMVRYQIWLSRNSIRNDGVTISFVEFYLTLKHYLLGHIQILDESKNTKAGIRIHLVQLVNSIKTVLKPGLSEFGT